MTGPFLLLAPAAVALDRPYRQRIYRVTEPEQGLFTSEVFALPGPAALVGAFRDPARLDADGNQVWGAEAGPYSFQRTER